MSSKTANTMDLISNKSPIQQAKKMPHKREHFHQFFNSMVQGKLKNGIKASNERNTI